MISFVRQDSKILVRIQIGVLNNYYELAIAKHDEVDAYLLREQFTKHLREELKKIAQSEYERGWKDAKAKRKKSDWFKSWWIPANS